MKRTMASTKGLYLLAIVCLIGVSLVKCEGECQMRQSIYIFIPIDSANASSIKEILNRGETITIWSTNL